MKALDNKNATARKKALAGKQPYYKAVVEYEKACPFCDTLLHKSDRLFSYACECSYWTTDYISNIYKRIKRPKT